jgi:hypothetical protein
MEQIEREQIERDMEERFLHNPKFQEHIMKICKRVIEEERNKFGSELDRIADKLIRENECPYQKPKRG